MAGLLTAAAARLAAAGIDTPRADAEWLLAGVLGARRGDLGLRLAQTPDAGLVTRYEVAIERRQRREPLQRILGWEGFRGLRLHLGPGALVPRPETEGLVDLAVGLLPPSGSGRRPVVVDVGTGSGCIACAIAAERADVQVFATDTAVTALEVARDNALRLGLSRVHVVAADLLTAVGPAVADLVVSNPPYLPTDLLPTLAPEVRDHEPRAALDGGRDGLCVLARLLVDARRALRPGGWLALETAGGAQAEAVRRLAEDAGLVDVAVHEDLAGVTRFITAGAGGSDGSSAGSAGAVVAGGRCRKGGEAPLRV